MKMNKRNAQIHMENRNRQNHSKAPPEGNLNLKTKDHRLQAKITISHTCFELRLVKNIEHFDSQSLCPWKTSYCLPQFSYSTVPANDSKYNLCIVALQKTSRNFGLNHINISKKHFDLMRLTIVISFPVTLEFSLGLLFTLPEMKLNAMV